MGRKTPLYECHLVAQAKMVDFAGWELPIHYGSQLTEHQAVRQQAGVFDVSHMQVIDVHGKAAAAYLCYLLANNVGKLIPGQALYSCLLKEDGGILDDLIVYKLDEDFFRLVVNAATAEKDLSWLRQQLAVFELTLTPRNDLAILATQGPQAAEMLAVLFKNQATALRGLKPFHSMQVGDKFVARTGYTGEDGYEWLLPSEEAPAFWQALLAVGFVPCGLGARDTLRLEAGFNLYGMDIDESVTPLEANIGWTVAWLPEERKFIGRQALEQQRERGAPRKLVGLVVDGQGIPRAHQQVIIGEGLTGEVTSGSFSPTLKQGIALARVPAVNFDQCWIDIRGKQIKAKVIHLPFVKYGKKAF